MTSAPEPGSVRPGAVHPFTGCLVTEQWAHRVVSPMLDAIGHRPTVGADSWLRISQAHTASEGAAALRRLVDAGAFRPPGRGYYAYRIADQHNGYVGLVADVEAVAFVDGRVRGHEAVQPERVEAVLRYFGAVPARSELVALLRASTGHADEVIAATQEGRPLLDFRSADGLRQTVWRVDDDRSALLDETLGVGPLYVADGHHRVAASLASWFARGRPAGITLPCVLYPPQGLRLHSFHRRVHGPVDGQALRAALDKMYDVQAVAEPDVGVGRFAVWVAGEWLVAIVPPDGVGVDALDVVHLHNQVLAPVLGITEVGDPRLDVIPASEPLSTLVDACRADAGAAFVLAAPTVAQLVDVADRGQVMLAKSTFFEPKPQAGVFLQPTRPHDVR